MKVPLIQLEKTNFENRFERQCGPGPSIVLNSVIIDQVLRQFFPATVHNTQNTPCTRVRPA